jgi:photosystem II stability/assembly factor-like uncharacterized protein
MKQRLRPIVGLFAILCAIPSAHAQLSGTCDKNHYILHVNGPCVGPALPMTGVNPWTAIGLDGATIQTLAVDPRQPITVYAATAGIGMLKSVDGGSRWTSINRGLATWNIASLAIDPTATSVLYAGTDDGVFKSADGGENWTAAKTGLERASRVVVYGIAIDPAAPTILYAATSAGLYKSTDSAASWTLLAAGLSGVTPQLIAINSASALYVGSGYKLFKSMDGGASWTQASLPNCGTDCIPLLTALAADPYSPSVVYAARRASGAGIVRSTDGGESWAPVEGSPSATSFAFDPTTASTIYATAGQIAVSTDRGEHWAPLGAVPASVTPASSIAIAGSDPKELYAGATGGIVRSSDDGQTWERLTLGVAAAPVKSWLAVDPTTPATLYTSFIAGRVAKTTDGGSHWIESLVGDDQFIRMLVIDPKMPSTLYAAGPTSLLKSVDAGANWMPVPGGPRPSYFPRSMAIAPSDPATLYVMDDVKGLMKTTDAGNSWTIVYDPGGGDLQEAPLYVDPTNDAVLYATPVDNSESSMIFKSIDGGAHWRTLLSGYSVINSFVIDPTAPSVLYAVDTGRGILKSTDGGETWASVYTVPWPTFIWALAVDPSSPSRLYAGTSAGVHRSLDGGATWTPLPSAPPSFDLYELAVDRTGTLLRAATAAGLYEYRLDKQPATVAVVEYYDAASDHYFITADPAEIAALDQGTSGWSRTGLQFNAYAAPSVDSVPVCRFTTTQAVKGKTHFYTPFAAECALLRANPDWLIEDAAAFHIDLPAPDGTCATGRAPIYRLYNNGQGGGPNHRYTTDLVARGHLLALGWTLEGIGEESVSMCSLR